MLIVTGSVTARPDSFAALRQASLDHVARSRTEPGCISHAVHVDCENPLRLFFFERWADMAALKVHFRAPGSLEFVGQARALSDGGAPLSLFEASELS